MQPTQVVDGSKPVKCRGHEKGKRGTKDMCKATAIQTAPEYAESPFWRDYSETDNGTYYDGLTIISMDRFSVTRTKHTELFDLIADNAEEADEVAEDFRTGDGAYYAPYCRNYTEYIDQTFRPKKRLSARKIHRLKELFNTIAEAYHPECEADAIAEVMTILTGEKYEAGTLTGYCQGDIVQIVYKVDEWSKEALESLETEFWNGGREYNITTEDDPEGYFAYFTEWNDDELIKAIADTAGTTPEEVELVNQ